MTEITRIGRKDFQGMTGFFIEEGFDAIKLEQIEDLQIVLFTKQKVYYEKYLAKEIEPEEYVDLFNTLLYNTFLKVEEILGTKDFIKLFGAPRAELKGFIDKEFFLKNRQL